VASVRTCDLPIFPAPITPTLIPVIVFGR
jgi:hypothetical protein